VKGFCVVVLMNGLVVDGAVVAVEAVVVAKQETVSGEVQIKVTGSKIVRPGHIPL